MAMPASGVTKFARRPQWDAVQKPRMKRKAPGPNESRPDQDERMCGEHDRTDTSFA
jgi:hypothetical protein